MKLLPGFLALGVALASAAPVPHWKPAEFEPLTELPWEKAGRSVEQIIGAIFKEPDPDVRYPVLLGYLQTLPVADFSKAFDLALELESRHEPDRLVAMMLGLWAKRDPRSAWERTKALFKVVGIEDGWLNYDSWLGRPKITVVDRSGLARSRFWLCRDTLTEFPVGVEESSLPEAERVQYLRDFSTLWFATFSTWPGCGGCPIANPREADDVVQAFHWNPADFKTSNCPLGNFVPQACFEIGMRRWLIAAPKEAPQVIQRIRKQNWPADPVRNLRAEPASVTPALLLIWAKADPEGLQAWADGAREKADQGNAWLAKCILMSMVKPAVRERWLASLDSMKPEDFKRCLETLAKWDPVPAFERVVRSEDSDLISRVFDDIGYGPWPRHPHNTSLAGLDFLDKLDFRKYPEDVRKVIFNGVGETVLPEQWGHIDIGQCARWGLRYLLSDNSGVPRSSFVALLGGDDAFASDGDVIDRTFCSLRVWAVTRPDEVREWIKTQEGEDLKKALTWLLDHPWGGPAEERAKDAESGKKN